MKIFTLLIFIVILNFLLFANKTYAENSLEDYLNDFYTKTNEASKILEEIQTNLKEGSRVNVCSKQRQAARIGLSANESLIKAFELNQTEAPTSSLRSSQRRWEALLNDC